GWAPYRSGQWRWVRPWGWTWVDQAPWGYAPFHYGRWVTIGNRWCWWPGGYYARPIWAPALVGFVGGSNLSVWVGFGGVCRPGGRAVSAPTLASVSPALSTQHSLRNGHQSDDHQ